MTFFGTSTLVSLVQFEADRRAFIITINSFGTELSKEDRAKLFPHCGKLYPEGLAQLARADDYEQVKAVADFYPVSSKSCGLSDAAKASQLMFLNQLPLFCWKWLPHLCCFQFFRSLPGFLSNICVFVSLYLLYVV